MAKSPLFSINEFNKPKVLDSSDSDTLLVYNIITGRADSAITKDLKFNINKYRFKDIMNSKSEIESTLRNFINNLAPEVYLDNIEITKINTGSSRINKTLLFTINIVRQNSNQRETIFFKITNKDQNNLLVDIINS